MKILYRDPVEFPPLSQLTSSGKDHYPVLLGVNHKGTQYGAGRAIWRVGDEEDYIRILLLSHTYQSENRMMYCEIVAKHAATVAIDLKKYYPPYERIHERELNEGPISISPVQAFVGTLTGRIRCGLRLIPPMYDTCGFRNLKQSITQLRLSAARLRTIKEVE